MPNDYFNFDTQMVPNTKILADQVNSQYALIEAAFDKLSDPQLLISGASIYGVDSGAANSYSVATPGADANLNAGRLLTFVPVNQNTTVSTISLNGGSNRAVVRNNGDPLQADDLVAGQPVMLIYDAANSKWFLVGATDPQLSTVFRPGIETVGGVSYTLTPSDEAKLLLFSNSSPVTVTVQPDSLQSLPVGFITHVNQSGVGQVTIQAGAGVTLRFASSAVTRKQYSSLSLFKTGADEYSVIGDAEAVDMETIIADAVDVAVDEKINIVASLPNPADPNKIYFVTG